MIIANVVNYVCLILESWFIQVIFGKIIHIVYTYKHNTAISMINSGLQLGSIVSLKQIWSSVIYSFGSACKVCGRHLLLIQQVKNMWRRTNAMFLNCMSVSSVVEVRMLTIKGTWGIESHHIKLGNWKKYLLEWRALHMEDYLSLLGYWLPCQLGYQHQVCYGLLFHYHFLYMSDFFSKSHNYIKDYTAVIPKRYMNVQVNVIWMSHEKPSMRLWSNGSIDVHLWMF